MSVNTHSILEALHGKKAMIVSICSLIVSFLVTRDIVSQDVSVLISGILVILGGGADIATKQLLSTSRK